MYYFKKDQLEHEKLYPCSPSTIDITSSCWSFARNEAAEESCIVQVEPCDDDGDQSDAENISDQSDVSNDRRGCVKITDENIELEKLEFYDGTPIICRDLTSHVFKRKLIGCF